MIETQAQRIVGRFGGAIKMAELTGIPLETVKSWVRAANPLQTIPPKHYFHILVCARRHGIILSTHDFVAHLDEMLAAHVAAERVTETSGTSPASLSTTA